MNYYCGRCGVGRVKVKYSRCLTCRYPSCFAWSKTVEGLNETIRRNGGSAVVTSIRVIGPDHPFIDTGGCTFFELNYRPVLWTEMSDEG